MSREREADAELQAMLKAELQGTTAQRVLTLLAEAMAELANDDPELRWYWMDGAAQTRTVAKETNNWG